MVAALYSACFDPVRMIRMIYPQNRKHFYSFFSWRLSGNSPKSSGSSVPAAATAQKHSENFTHRHSWPLNLTRGTAMDFTAYRDRLRQHAEELNTPPVAIENRNSMAPLIDRLRRFIDTLPPDEKAKPRGIEFFAERLRGRWHPTPHRGELARCLRKLGFTSRRNFKKSSPTGTSSMWFAPKH